MSNVSYDVVGVGAGGRGIIRDDMIEHGYKFAVYPCNAGGSVVNPDQVFIRGRRGQTNKMYFADFGSQAGWQLRMRGREHGPADERRGYRSAPMLVHQP